MLRTSKAGPINLHGPHQEAQKSITNSCPSAFSNNSWKSPCKETMNINEIDYCSKFNQANWQV